MPMPGYAFALRRLFLRLFMRLFLLLFFRDFFIALRALRYCAAIEWRRPPIWGGTLPDTEPG